MAHLEHKHEPKHGMARMMVDGKIKHYALCPESCCPKDLPAISSATNVMPEVQSLVDILHRHIKDVDAKGHAHGEKLTAAEIALESSIETLADGVQKNNQAIYDLIRDREEAFIKYGARLAQRIAELENRTLWHMVKLCFK